MSQENIFNSEQTTAPQQQAQQPSTQQPAFNDLLASITNEKGEPKYRDVPTAMDALKHSQAFIAQLKAEKDALAAEKALLASENEKLKTVEETVFKLTSQQQQQTTTSPVITEEVVASLVQDTLNKREQATDNKLM